MRLAVLTVLIAALTACAGAASCDLREATISDPEPRCQERTGAQGTPLFSAFCDPLGGEGINGECPDREDIVGGCRTASVGGDVTDWYYPPETPETVQASCDEDDATYIPASDA